ncbi:chromosome partitioning protein ParA [Vibrio neptunius]|uniref:Chromosome partitioning protein ParA n=1 Tax=Vibrio neptunius TaxID=170651 RepID=A0ABS3A5F5_9VIBR|nr:chromosome partitioning protein ParA [Vibrio neptunius]MBN3494207.1 chromosome partitioning protein ParA [Vibrio neptunius]MBN3516611.1 chromosome partitioning protein ParA [Vibrio neptunius]MBN3550902.1 chromosome partitioning protein ParA [Vibrio neptunius]MBN3579031.1 chromosome partitioning protein ParA [Vibrio neptunius]MCH9872695.1 chromosome partitioning protein ParA [Vibrio neptunius]
MDLAPLLTTENLIALAVDLGLLILLVWFVILLLILREFRHFAKEVVHGKKNMDDNTYEVCQQSVDSALNYTAENNDTLNDLILIQQALEAQVSQIKSANQGGLSAEDQESIEDLNLKLSKSHQLIKKLKGDLSRSINGLKKAKNKLLRQSDTVESLQQEKEQLEKQFEQLEQEYVEISEAGGFSKLEQEYQNERQQLLGIIETYKKKAAEKGDLGEVKAQLEAVQQQLHHTIKEKDFVEQKYLDLMKEAEDKNP